MSSIKVSPKHGLNPTMGICFFCGKPTDEIGLMGRLKNDKEAPRHSVLSYEPCDECKAVFDQGITLFGYTNTQPKDGRPSIGPRNEPSYPTGSVITIREESASRVLSNYLDEEHVEDIISKRRAWVPDVMVQRIIASAQADDKNTEGDAGEASEP